MGGCPGVGADSDPSLEVLNSLLSCSLCGEELLVGSEETGNITLGQYLRQLARHQNFLWFVGMDLVQVWGAVPSPHGWAMLHSWGLMPEELGTQEAFWVTDDRNQTWEVMRPMFLDLLNSLVPLLGRSQLFWAVLSSPVRSEREMPLWELCENLF
jgi:hypothetical protein